MFIEVALKNICLTVLLENLKSDDVNVLFEKGINSYKNCPKFFSEKKKEKIQETFLSLKTNIYTIIFNEYKKKNSVITHYYQIGQSYIPLYSIFEVLTLGSFGLLYKSLTYELRNEISIKLNLNKSLDSNREVLGDYIYLFKDLRNSIAHNKVIYDCRFKDKEITFQMKECLSNSLNYPYINFKDIFDYIALISYFLKILNIDKNAIKDFIDTFIKYVDDFKSTVSNEIVEIIFNKNHVDKIVALKKLIDF